MKSAPVILIIEDEKALAELLREEVTQMGYRAVVASNGVEGLAMIQDTQPDVILCDRAMPSMTGSQLLERLRGIYPQYASLPFIFLTALTDPGEKASVEALRPYAYLEKPVDFEVLQHTILQALN